MPPGPDAGFKVKAPGETRRRDHETETIQQREELHDEDLSPGERRLLGVCAATGASAQTLNDIKNRGALICGVNSGIAGFAAPDANGHGRASTSPSAAPSPRPC
jgi:general L-amino acid transport system substrate-binding protein